MVAAVVSVSLLLSAGTGVTPAALHKAKELTRRSLREYDEGKLDEAYVDAAAAYDVDPIPAFLFNMAQCQRALRQWNKAEFLYRRYLARAPRAKNRRTVEALIAAMERRQGKAPEAKAPQLPELTVVPLVPAGSKAPEEVDRVAATVDPGFLRDEGPVVVVREEAARPVKPARRWAWICTWAAAGLVALGTAAGIAARLDSDAAARTSWPVTPAAAPGLSASMSGAQTFGIAANALWIAGGASAISAAALFLVSRPEKSAVTLGPSLAGTGLAATGTF